MNIARVLIGHLAIALLVSCTLSQRDPTGFIPMRDAPAPEYTPVSSYFGVEVTGGIFSPRRILFFHIQADGQSKELIGSNLFPVYESRQGAYAISEDGKDFLFMHDERLNQDHLKKDTGLYQFTHGIGDRLIDATARSGIYINETLPSNAIVFKRPGAEYKMGEDPVVVRSTDGTERIWQRPQKKDKPQAKESTASPCHDPSLYDTADAHPEIRWLSTQRGAGCIFAPDVDSGTIEMKEYMSSGLYKFIRECRIDDQNTYRLFEYKNKGRPYLLRLHTNQFVDPKTYVIIRSYRQPAGNYLHSIVQSSNHASSIKLCPPEGINSK